MTDALSKVANQSSAPKCIFSTYINVGGRLTKTGGSLVDTALYIKECEIRLFKAGPA